MTQEEQASRARARWYKEAVIYQAHVRAFLDSTSDGVGDFQGLTSRLDYLDDLGVDTLWLLPFYPSPLKDDGYDIADYENIHPRTARSRISIGSSPRRTGAACRVVTELVINHTSDQHPWFQAARRAPAGIAGARASTSGATRTRGTRACRSSSPTPRRRTGRGTTTAGALLLASVLPPPARPELRQPDVVLEAVIRVMRFWLDLRRRRHAARRGAVPHRARRDAPARTSTETHAILKRIRAEMDARLSRPDAARRGEPVAGRRAAVLRRRRRVPHGVPLPADAADVHGRAPGGPASDRRDPAPDARHPRQLPVGPLPPQPRRADARDGHRRGARLHVSGVRRRSRRCGSTSASGGVSRR